MLSFTYWGGSQLSLLNVISLISFARFNPNSKLIIYTISNFKGVNQWLTEEQKIQISHFFDLRILSGEPNIEILEVNHRLPQYKNINSHIHMADFIRIEKLHDHGGLWIDTDILFLSSIQNLNLENDRDMACMTYFNVCTTGLIYSKPSTLKMKILLNNAISLVQDNKFRKSYQALGPSLWTNLIINNRINFHDINFLDAYKIYPYMYPELGINPNLYDFYYGDDDFYIDNKIQGIHWYNGNELSKYFIEYHLTDSLRANTSFTPFSKVINHLKTHIALGSFLDSLDI